MLVSIIIPYVKDRGFLKAAIKSCKNQTYENIEIIRSKGKGTLGENFNKGLKKSKGEFIKILADDDILPVRSIEYLMSGIKSDFCVADSLNFTNKRDIWMWTGKETNLKEMLKRNTIHGGAVLYRRSAFEKYGMMDESLVTAEEYDLHLRWLSKGATHNYISKVVYNYRMWEGSKSQIIAADFGSARRLSRINYLNKIRKRYV